MHGPRCDVSMSSPRRTKRRYLEFQPGRDLIQLAEIEKRKRAQDLDKLVEQEAKPIKTHTKASWKRFMIYALRWQLSTPITFFCIWLLPFGPMAKAVLSNIIGACALYKIDKRIFKG